MAESNLSVAYADLQVEVAYYLGLGRTVPTDAGQLDTIERCIRAGVRQFYNPPAVTASGPHAWSFLRPVTTLSVSAPYSTGTIELTLGSATVTLTDGTWPSWAASGELVVDGIAYGVASRGGDTSLTLDSAWALASTGAGHAYSLERSVYDLSDDFGSLDGDITYADDEGISADSVIRQVGEARIRALRQNSVVTGTPTMAAVRPKAATGTVGQRFEMLFWPTPDDSYVLSFRYRILPTALGGDTGEHSYPLGSAVHAETLIASCLAAAEHRINDARGQEYQYFIERLQASIAADLEQQPDSLGYNGNVKSGTVRWTHGDQCTVGGILYDGA